MPCCTIWVGMGGKIKEHFMNKIPSGLTVIYFDDKDKIYMRNYRPTKSKQKSCQGSFTVRQ